MAYNTPAQVKQVQAAINTQGYTPPLVVDGLMGPKTIAGIKAFQTLHHLTPDGIVGPLTMAATIAPTPAAAAIATAVAANPLAALSQQIAQLGQSPGSAPTAPQAPLLSMPVVSMAQPQAYQAQPAAQAQPAYITAQPPPAAPPAPGQTYTPPPAALVSAAITPKAPTVGGMAIPVWAATAAGAIVGLPFGGLVGAGIGGAVGAAVDLARSMMNKPA
jgi:peptidoglycan hydrolase-like protein with peptidoglycan-binding domain